MLQNLVCRVDWLLLSSPQSFFYIDPPYVGTDQGHYPGYTIDDYVKLLELIRNIQGSFILSGYDIDDDYINDLLKYKRVEFNAKCSASGQGRVGADRSRKSTKEELGNRKRTEVIWIKQSIKPREEIQKLYDSGRYDCFTGG